MAVDNNENTNAEQRNYKDVAVSDNTIVSEIDHSKSTFVEIKVDDVNSRALLYNSAPKGTVHWLSDFGLWEVTDPSILLSDPTLSALPTYDYEMALRKKREKEILENTNNQVMDIRSRVYLDHVPTYLLAWANNPANGVFFDKEKKAYFVRQETLARPNMQKILKACRMERKVYATDFGSVLTPGKEALAAAFLEKDPIKREYAIGKALAICSKEKAMGVKGAIQDFQAVIVAHRKAGINIGFMKAWSMSIQFYKDVGLYAKETQVQDESVKNQILTKEGYTLNVETGREQEQNRLNKIALIDEKVFNTYQYQASKNIKDELFKRISTAMYAPDPNRRVELAAEAIFDYVKAHAKTCEACVHLNKFNNDHNQDKFVANIYQTLERTADIIDKRQNSTQVDKEINRQVIERVKILAMQANSECQTMNRLQSYLNSTRNGYMFASPNLAEQVMQNLKQMPQNFESYLKDHALLRTPVQHVIANHNKVNELELEKTPLFIVADYKERKELLKQYGDEIKIDPVFNALCVEDTKENRVKFANYLPKYDLSNTNQAPDLSAITQQAIAHLNRNGFDIDPKNIKFDQWVNDPKDHSKAYIINIKDGVPRMQMYDRNGSLNETQVLGKLTAEQRSNYANNAFKIEQNNNALKYEAQKQTSVLINNAIKDLPKIEKTHEYLRKKGLTPKDLPNLLHDPSGQKLSALFKQLGQQTKADLSKSLVVPLYDVTGKLKSAQLIDEQGNKTFIKNSALKGNFFPIGDVKNADTILICEGVATAASIAKNLPKGVAVVACMSCGNLEHVTKNLLKQYPDKGYAIMADNDLKSADTNKINAGLVHAEKARQAVLDEKPYIKVVRPPLSFDELMQGNSDFNDASKINPNAVKEVIDNVVYAVRDENRINMRARENIMKLSREQEQNIVENAKLVVDNNRTDALTDVYNAHMKYGRR